MIRRIKQIKNIGAFSNFVNGGSIQFEKLTFIFGLNTRGKTTLTDVFNSLKFNDSSFLQGRKSIPNTPDKQSVVLCYRKNEGGEKDIQFSGENWGKTDFSKTIEVFGTDFIHKNLFTGLSVERQNKENLTQFILGEEGVKLANEIANDKQDLRKKKGGLSSLVPKYVKNQSENEVNAFIELKINEFSKDELENQILDLKNAIKKEQERLSEPSKILNLADIQEYSVPETTIESHLNDCNKVLKKSYSDVSEDALKKLNEHINYAFKDKDVAEQWIREGFENKKGAHDACIFCGQSLSNAQDLISAYHSYFNDLYLIYVNEVSDTLYNLLDNFKNIKLNENANLIKQGSIIEKYNSLIISDTYRVLAQNFKKALESLNEDDLNQQITDFEGEFVDKMDLKLKKPFSAIQQLKMEEIVQLIKSYNSNLNDIKQAIDGIIIEIEEFKDKYRNTKDIEQRIKELEIQLTEKQKFYERILQDNECITYVKEKISIQKLAESITKKENDLSQEQNQYLKDFYDKINEYFDKFGSENFTLRKIENTRGHQPVYSLGVDFHGESISESNLSQVFSESDRRALGLAVFWAKIELMKADNKKNLIVVLDDPITSFDDNRILMSIDIFKETLSKVKQIIVLTHYPHFIRCFHERSMNDDFTSSFIEIDRDNISSKLVRTTVKKFAQSEYERVFIKIKSFIERESNDCIKSDLRPFLESLYIPTFYAKELREAEKEGATLNSLDNKIETIFKDNEQVRNQFHSYRKMLNSDSHLFTSNNPEDVRSFARNMINYLYNFSYNT